MRSLFRTADGLCEVAAHDPSHTHITPPNSFAGREGPVLVTVNLHADIESMATSSNCAVYASGSLVQPSSAGSLRIQ